jgi:hypothetical protein
MQAAMRTSLATALVLAAVGCGKAADPGHAIRGQVNDAWDRPLAGVEIATPDGKQTTSGADGRFTLVYGTDRPSAITLSRPGWAVIERAMAQSNRPADISIGTVSMVPALDPTLGEIAVLADRRVAAVENKPVEKLPVVPDPGGTPTVQLYRIAGPFVEVPVGKLRAITTPAFARLRPRPLFERAPESYAIAAGQVPLRPKPLKITGGGDMIFHEGLTTLGPGRYLLVVEPASPDGTAIEPTEGYLIVVK